MPASRVRAKVGSGSKGRMIGLLLTCLALAFILLGTASGAPAPSAVTDVNPIPAPPVQFGGRVDALAVDPVDAQNVFAAGELGGLWHSVDHGLHWSHVDTLPLFRMRDVEFAPTDSSLVIATGDYDGRQTSGAGIWRSTDGGATWSKPATADPGCTTEPSAHGVAIAPTGTPGSIRVWVGTSCGIAFSSNSGASWTHIVPAGGGGNQIWDVQARDLGGGVFQVDACGDQSYVRSTTGGATGGSYASPGTPVPGTGFGPCHLATAPQDANTVYMTYFSNTTPAGFCQAQIDESSDGGATWEQMGVGDQNCRFPYVVTHPALDGNANNYEVFAGTSVRLVHQTCDSTVAARCAPGGGNWTNISARRPSRPVGHRLRHRLRKRLPDPPVERRRHRPDDDRTGLLRDDVQLDRLERGQPRLRHPRLRGHGQRRDDRPLFRHAGQRALLHRRRRRHVHAAGRGGRLRPVRRPQRTRAGPLSHLLRLQLEHRRAGAGRLGGVLAATRQRRAECVRGDPVRSAELRLHHPRPGACRASGRQHVDAVGDDERGRHLDADGARAVAGHAVRTSSSRRGRRRRRPSTCS